MDFGSLSGMSASQAGAKPVSSTTPSVAQEREIPSHANRASEESTESRSAKSSEGESAAPVYVPGENRANNPEAAMAAGKTKGVNIDMSV